MHRRREIIYDKLKKFNGIVGNEYGWIGTGDSEPVSDLSFWRNKDKEGFYIISKGENLYDEATAPPSGNNPEPDTPTEPTKPTESPTTPPPSGGHHVYYHPDRPPSGDITNAFEEPKKTIRIDKVDGHGKALAGARLLIKDSKGELVSQWTTVAGESQSLSLEAGSYILQEVEAPQGYHKVDDVLFSVDKEGKLSLVGSMLSVHQAKVEGNLLTVIDEAEVVKYPVTISKVDARGKPLAEAMLTLKNAEGVVAQAWRSDANQSQLLQLSEGSYTLEETNAPKGYKKITALSFHVAQDGTVTLQKDTDTAYKTRIEGNRLIVTDEEESTVAATKTAAKPSAAKSVKTGDDSAVLFWLMMALVAGTVAVGSRRQRRD